MESVRLGYMNFSKYARAIKLEVEKDTMKSVDEKTIVVNLSRLAGEIEKKDRDKKNIKLLHLYVHSNLEDLSYYKSNLILEQINQVRTEIPNIIETFFVITQGMSEINIIGEQNVVRDFKTKLSNNHPLYYKMDLVGISAKFSLNYLDVPNVLHEIGKKLALKNINIIEVVSTTSEINYILNKKDLDLAVSQITTLL